MKSLVYADYLFKTYLFYYRSKSQVLQGFFVIKSVLYSMTSFACNLWGAEAFTAGCFSGTFEVIQRVYYSMVV